MTIYRLVKAEYRESAFRGSRGRGRWHELGTPMVYAADAPATALLETLVHVDRAALLNMSFVLFRISFDPDAALLQLPDEERPDDWDDWPWPASAQRIGTMWHEAEASLVLEVPSAVLPQQRNFLLNMQHPDIDQLSIEGPTDFQVDARLGE